MADDGERVAAHEAGHAAMAYLLGRRVQLVSIAPTAHFGGIMFHATPKYPGDMPNLCLPVPMQPAPFRRWVETSILISLAGPESAFRLAPIEPYTGYVQEEPDELHAAALARLAAPTPREQKQLEAESRKGECESDEVKAESLGRAFAGETTGSSYLGWMRAETRSIVTSRRFIRLVGALVPVLLERTTISGRLVRRIFTDTIEGADGTRIA